MTRITPCTAGVLDLTTMPIGTRLVTRGGNRARLLANDLRGIEPCLIAVDVGGDMEQIHNVGAGGWVSEPPAGHPHDVVGVERPKHRVRVKLVLCGDGRHLAVAWHEDENGFGKEDSNPYIADQIVEIEESAP